MRAILDFNLPEEASEFELASNAGKLASCLHELREYLRFKHMDKEPSPSDIRDRFYEILDDCGALHLLDL